jgi:hypothetical protein
VLACAGTSESESGTSDSGSEAGMTYTSRDESVLLFWVLFFIPKVIYEHGEPW